MGQPSVPSNNSAPAFSEPHGYGPPTHFSMEPHHYSPYQSTARPNDVNGPWIGYNGMFGQQAEGFGYNNNAISFNFHSFLTTLSISCGLLLFNQCIILVYILTKACLMPMYI